MGKLNTIALGLIALFVGATVAAVAVQYQYPNNGTIVEPLEVTLAGAPLQNLEEIEWMDCARGQTTEFGLFNVTNTGTVTVTISLTNGTMPEGLTLTWEPPNGFILAPDEFALAPLTLTVTSDAALGAFKFDLFLDATA